MERNILILEDNEKCMDAIVDIISDCNNVNIFTASNISDALSIAYKNRIHLFLVDIILNPEMKEDVSGLDFVKALRENKKYEFTPVIFITALEDPKLYSYSQLHCYGYIEKPFDVTYVKKIVTEALEFPVKNTNDGNTLILNTRTSQALTQAGIPRSQWVAIDRTGNQLFEQLLDGQLSRNKLTSEGISTVRPGGKK